MKLRHLMTPNPATVKPESTLKRAAEVMREADVGGLPVIQDGEVVGFVTDRDIVTRSTAFGHDPTKTAVGQIMTEEAFCLYEDNDVADAQQLMKTFRVRRTIVLDRTGKTVGILSLSDLALRSGVESAGIAVLQAVSQPTHTETPHS